MLVKNHADPIYEQPLYDLFFLVVLKIVCTFIMYLWNLYVSRPGHLPEALPPFVEMETLMGNFFLLKFM